MKYDAGSGQYTSRSATLAGIIREGDLKLIVSGKKSALYNLKDDLSETTDIAAEQPVNVQAMKAKWMTWAENRKPARLKGGENIQYADYDWLKGSPHYKEN